MTVNVVSLFKTAPDARDWSNQELAEFYRVESSLIRAGLSIETDRGLSDEGDPWFVFFHPETGDIIIHFARFDGSYAVASCAFDRCVRGDDLRLLVEALIATHPLAIANANSDAKISIHPAALMVVLVMTCFFKLAQTQAFASQFDAGGSQTSPAARTDHGAAVKPGSVMVDEGHTQMLLTAIAYAVSWADSGAMDSTLFAEPGAPDIVQPLVSTPNSEKADAGLNSADDSGLAFEHLGQPADHAQLPFGDVAAAPSVDRSQFHAILETQSMVAFDNVLFDRGPMSVFHEADMAKVASADQSAGNLVWLPAMVHVAPGAKGAVGTAIATATTNTQESGGEVNDQAAALKVNVEDNTRVNAHNPFVMTADPANHLDIAVGDPLHVAGDALGNAPSTGDKVASITAKGGADTVGFIALTPTLTGNQYVTLGGDQALTIGTAVLGAIAEFDSTITGLLNPSKLTLTVTDSAAVTLYGATGGYLNFITDAAAVPLAPAISYSTNAVTIDASGSGGALTMLGGDANFAAGATITGSAIGGNVLGGSIGNDTIKSLSASGGDTIFTNGGADTISLAAGHTGADHIDLYAGIGLVVGGAIPSVANSISEISGRFDTVNPGWWGISAGNESRATTVAVAAGHGTSFSQTTVTNFVAGAAGAPQDVLDFSIKAWGVAAGTNFGLSTGTFAAATAGTLNIDNVQNVNNGDTIRSTTELLVLKTGTFADANAVTTAFQTGGYNNLTHALLAAGQSAHWLVEYQDLSSNVHIADLFLVGTGGTTTGADIISASDMVQLIGVNEAQLHPGNIHLVG